MIYILIVLGYTSHGGNVVTFQEFADAAACENAKRFVMLVNRHVTCVPKASQ